MPPISSTLLVCGKCPCVGYSNPWHPGGPCVACFHSIEEHDVFQEEGGESVFDMILDKRMERMMEAQEKIKKLTNSRKRVFEIFLLRASHSKEKAIQHMDFLRYDPNKRGRAVTMKDIQYGEAENAAVVKIQTIFRGYMARNLRLKKIEEQKLISNIPKGPEADRAAAVLQRIATVLKARRHYWKLKKWNAARNRIAAEVLNTEKTYVANLKAIIEKFVVPLRASVGRQGEILSEEQIEGIFSNIEEIYQVNLLLYEKLKQRIGEHWSCSQVIGDVLIEMVEKLRAYTSYNNNFGFALGRIERLRKRISKFARFLDDVQGDPELGSISLQSYLIMPVQRIPKYQQLLEDLIRNTWDDHRDYESLTKTQEKIKKVAEIIKESVRATENLARLVEIQDSFVGKYENIVQAGRELVTQGQMIEIRSDGAEISVHCFLFNDCLVLAQEKRRKTYKYMYRLDLSIVNVETEGLNPRLAAKHGFRLEFPTKTIILATESEHEKHQWAKQIGDVSKQLITNTLNLCDQGETERGVQVMPVIVALLTTPQMGMANLALEALANLSKGGVDKDLCEVFLAGGSMNNIKDYFKNGALVQQEQATRILAAFSVSNSVKEALKNEDNIIDSFAEVIIKARNIVTPSKSASQSDIDEYNTHADYILNCATVLSNLASHSFLRMQIADKCLQPLLQLLTATTKKNTTVQLAVTRVLDCLIVNDQLKKVFVSAPNAVKVCVGIQWSTVIELQYLATSILRGLSDKASTKPLILQNNGLEASIYLMALGNLALGVQAARLFGNLAAAVKGDTEFDRESNGSRKSTSYSSSNIGPEQLEVKLQLVREEGILSMMTVFRKVLQYANAQDNEEDRRLRGSVDVSYDPESVEQVVRALYSVVQVHPTECHKYGVVDMVIQVMNRGIYSLSAVEWAARCLAILASVDKIQLEISQKPRLATKLTLFLKIENSSEILRDQSARTLASIASVNDAASDEAAEAKAIQYLIQGIIAYEKGQKASSRLPPLLDALGVISGTVKNGAVIVEGGIQPLVSLLTSTSAPVVESTARAMWKMSHDDDLCIRIIGERGGIQALIGVLLSKSMAMRQSVLKECVEAVSVLCVQESNKEIFRRQGGIQALLNTLMMEEVRITTCLAFRDMFETSDKLRLGFKDANGGKAILSLLEDTKFDAKTVVVEALFALAENDKARKMLIEDKSIQVLLNLLADSRDLQYLAAVSLRFMLSDGDPRCSPASVLEKKPPFPLDPLLGKAAGIKIPIQKVDGPTVMCSAIEGMELYLTSSPKYHTLGPGDQGNYHAWTTGLKALAGLLFSINGNVLRASVSMLAKYCACPETVGYVYNSGALPALRSHARGDEVQIKSDSKFAYHALEDYAGRLGLESNFEMWLRATSKVSKNLAAQKICLREGWLMKASRRHGDFKVKHHDKRYFRITFEDSVARKSVGIYYWVDQKAKNYKGMIPACDIVGIRINGVARLVNGPLSVDLVCADKIYSIASDNEYEIASWMGDIQEAAAWSRDQRDGTETSVTARKMKAAISAAGVLQTGGNNTASPGTNHPINLSNRPMNLPGHPLFTRANTQSALDDSTRAQVGHRMSMNTPPQHRMSMNQPPPPSHRMTIAVNQRASPQGSPQPIPHPSTGQSPNAQATMAMSRPPALTMTQPRTTTPPQYRPTATTIVPGVRPQTQYFPGMQPQRGGFRNAAASVAMQRSPMQMTPPNRPPPATRAGVPPNRKPPGG